MMSPQLDTDSINTTASSVKSTTSTRISDHAVEGNSMEHQESSRDAMRSRYLNAYVATFLDAALDQTSALQQMLATGSVRASSFVMSGVSKLTPSWIPTIRQGIRENLLKPHLGTEGVDPEVASRMLDLGECGLSGVLCSSTLLLGLVIELISRQDCRIIQTCMEVCRLYVIDLFFVSIELRTYHTEALRNQATSSSDLVIRAALRQHIDDGIGPWWWIYPLICPIFAAIFGFDLFIALGYSVALFAWSDTRRASVFQRNTIRLGQLSDEKTKPEIASRSLNAALAASLLATRERQLQVEHEKFAALEQRHLKLAQQLQIERVQHIDAIEWYVRTTGVLGDQLCVANNEADNFRNALIDWHKYLTKQNDASKKRIDDLQTRNKGLEIECGTVLSRNRVLEEKEARYIAISNVHNEQNKSLREELRTMNGLIDRVNAVVDSTNEKLHRKEEAFTKLQACVQRKQYSHVEEQSRLITNHQKDVIELHKTLSADCDDKLARVWDEAKKEVDDKVNSIVTLGQYIVNNEAVDVDCQAELNQAKAQIKEKEKFIVMLKGHIDAKAAIDVGVQAEFIKARTENDEKAKSIVKLQEYIRKIKAIDIEVRGEFQAEIKKKEAIITMREEFILKTEETNIDRQAELDDAHHVNRGIVDHLTTLKKTITSQAEDLATEHRNNANLGTDLRAKNATIGGLKNDMRAAHADNVTLTRRRDRLLETNHHMSKYLGQLEVTQGLADQNLNKWRDRSSRVRQSLERAKARNHELQESTRANEEGLARIIVHLREELASERAKHDTKTKVDAKREASDACKVESMRLDMQALVDENDELMGIKEWDQVGENEGEDGDADSDAEMENEIDRDLDTIHKGARSLKLQCRSLRDELNLQNKHKLKIISTECRSHHQSQPDAEGSTTQQPGTSGPSENDSAMEMADQKPTTSRARTTNHEEDDDQETYISDESTTANESEPEIIDSEHSDDEDHLTPSRADIEYADELNSRWKPAQGGVNIRRYEEISMADTEDSDGELVDFTDVDDDESSGPY
ncbi:hypothetical protein BDV97DRAFT_405214 [Delphinella strobiligena]|nr:hypothetical protein BDV97DRAFT_405214 [Delphinella strobiligena]